MLAKRSSHRWKFDLSSTNHRLVAPTHGRYLAHDSVADVCDSVIAHRAIVLATLRKPVTWACNTANVLPTPHKKLFSDEKLVIKQVLR